MELSNLAHCLQLHISSSKPNLRLAISQVALIAWHPSFFFRFMYVSNPVETVQKGSVLRHFSAVNRLTTETMLVHCVGKGLAMGESTRLAKTLMI